LSISFKTIGLFGKYKDPSVREALNGLAEYLRYRKITVVIGETTAEEIIDSLSDHISPEELKSRMDLAIVIGGDGTMLHVARSLAPHGVPLVGVNMGRLGFLTDIPLVEMYEDVGRILDGEYHTEQRMMLKAEIWSGEELVFEDTAFNDMVIGKGELERLIEFQTYIDGEFVTESRADGMIVATPTGSTAYALSAGGPILHPQLESLILVPICPHTLSMRPIALKDSSVIDLTLVEICARCAHVSMDGQIRYHLEGDEKVRVRRAENTVQLVRTLEHNHYAALRSKLGWGENL
jgi:NAD+ kinase